MSIRVIRTRWRPLATSALSSMLMVACGGGGGTTRPAALPTVAVSPSPQSSASPTPALTTASIIYTVEAVTQDGTTSNYIQTISTTGSLGMAIGPFTGQIVVAGDGGTGQPVYVEQSVGSDDSILVYPAASETPSRSFSIQPPRGLVRFAVAAGLLYVPGGSLNTLNVYDVSNGSLVVSSPAGINDPIAVAVDSAGTAYLAGHSPNSVAVWPSGSGAPTNVITSLDGDPRGIAVGTNGDIYVAIGSTAYNEIQVFSASGATISRIPVPVPSDVVIDADGVLSVPCGNDTIVQFAANATVPSRTIALPGLPDSIAL